MISEHGAGQGNVEPNKTVLSAALKPSTPEPVVMHPSDSTVSAMKSEDMMRTAPVAAMPTSTPAAENVFHPPSAATAAAKSNDMFSQPAVAAPPPSSNIAATIFPTQSTPATSVADRLVLPPVNANDVKVGGAFAGLDPGSTVHGFGRQRME